jgi:hypothetical protein
VSKRRAEVVVLVEDKRQQVFVARLLQALGHQRHKLRLRPLPAGQGSGEQYVRENYAAEVRELRRRSGQLQLALVVVLDADTGQVADHQHQLASQLQSAGLDPRGNAERIVHLIPRRNIETWVEYLLGREVNETDRYPRLTGRERDCQPAVEQLVQLYRSNQPLPASCPPSLVTAIDELRRLG